MDGYRFFCRIPDSVNRFLISSRIRIQIRIFVVALLLVCISCAEIALPELARFLQHIFYFNAHADAEMSVLYSSYVCDYRSV